MRAAMIDVAALYHFAPLEDAASLREPLHARCVELDVKGTLLLASEGINGTIAGDRTSLDAVVAHIRAWPGFETLEVKYSTAHEIPFGRMKVKLKREIVTMGVEGVDARSDAGHYVAAADWNALISEPGVVLIDTRNDYEVAEGTFENAIDPQTGSFRQFPGWFEAQAEQWRQAGVTPKIAMFCTGGIRCEKATAYVRAQGFEEVYHLKGGILKYLETVSPAQSKWQGECFVFDEREALGHGLTLRAKPDSAGD